jgi:hypothetical protein
VAAGASLRVDGWERIHTVSRFLAVPRQHILARCGGANPAPTIAHRPMTHSDKSHISPTRELPTLPKSWQLSPPSPLTVASARWKCLPIAGSPESPAPTPRSARRGRSRRGRRARIGPAR